MVWKVKGVIINKKSYINFILFSEFLNPPICWLIGVEIIWGTKSWWIEDLETGEKYKHRVKSLKVLGGINKVK